jgi:iron(III) transport system substrate-binding protein
MKAMNKILTAVCTATILVAITACSGSSAPPSDAGSSTPVSMDALVAAAKAEGALTFYGDANETSLKAWTQGFTDKYGIPVSILRQPGSQLYQRFGQEASSGQYQADIFSNADRASMQQAVDQGWIEQYTPAGASSFPADQSDAGYYYPVQNGYFQTVAYNTDLLTPAEVAEVTADPIKAAGDPAFKGRVGVNMPQSSQQAAAFYYRYTDGDAAGQYGWDAMQKIADNKPLFYSSTTLVQNLIAGEYAIAVGVTDSLAAPAALTGAPIAFVYPKDTTGGYFSTGIVAHAPHPNAAKLFMEWATTPEANALYTTTTQTIPANSQVQDTRQLKSLPFYKAPDLSNVWFDFVTDPKFLAASAADGDYLSKWNSTFGYSG